MDSGPECSVESISVTPPVRSLSCLHLPIYSLMWVKPPNYREQRT